MDVKSFSRLDENLGDGDFSEIEKKTASQLMGDDVDICSGSFIQNKEGS